MANYTTTIEFDSVLISGLHYEIKKMSHGRRMQLNAQTASVHIPQFPNAEKTYEC